MILPVTYYPSTCSCLWPPMATSLLSFIELTSHLVFHILWPKAKVQNLGSGSKPPGMIILLNQLIALCTGQFTFIGEPVLPCSIGNSCAIMTFLKWVWSDKHLKINIRLYIHVYQTLVLSVLLYASDTWTYLVADVRSLDAFHQKCLQQLLRICWYNQLWNDRSPTLDQSSFAVLSSVLLAQLSLSGHMTQLGEDMGLPANTSLSQPPDHMWHPPGLSWTLNNWLDQLRDNSNRPLCTPVGTLSAVGIAVQHCDSTHWLSDHDDIDMYMLVCCLYICGLIE